VFSSSGSADDGDIYGYGTVDFYANDQWRSAGTDHDFGQPVCFYGDAGWEL
jgi:hypothetical protein